MITCRELIEFLDDYVADSQADSVREEFEQHLKVCRACRDFLKTYRETITLTAEVCSDPDAPVPTDVPEDLIQAVLAARRAKK